MGAFLRRPSRRNRGAPQKPFGSNTGSTVEAVRDGFGVVAYAVLRPECRTSPDLAG